MTLPTPPRGPHDLTPDLSHSVSMMSSTPRSASTPFDPKYIDSYFLDDNDDDGGMLDSGVTAETMREEELLEHILSRRIETLKTSMDMMIGQGST